jgi:hypothetical protein
MHGHPEPNEMAAALSHGREYLQKTAACLLPTLIAPLDPDEVLSRFGKTMARDRVVILGMDIDVAV